MINVSISKKVFNPVYLPIEDDESKYIVIYGGGSSGKSYYIGEHYIKKMMSKKMNLLVVRKTANTNRDSTFALLKQVIYEWKVESLFIITDLRIKCINGNEIIFRGSDDPEKLKSITFENGELTDVWIEEATECLEKTINQLKVRLRGGKSKKQMILSFNPVDINHWIKRHFIDSKLASVYHTTHKDNKFLTDEDRETLEAFKETDPYYYKVYCLGEWGILGKTFFNAEKISNRILELKAPLLKGAFTYDYDGLNIKNIKFVPDENGYIEIYEVPKKKYPYVLAGDTAGEGSDFFTGQVLENTTGKQVAKLKKGFDADEYTRQMYCLGKYFNYALIAIEANFDTFPIKELLRLGYTKQFIREREDNYTSKHIKSYGFKTTTITRPLILSILQSIVNDHIDLINDKETLEEMLVFVRNEKGRPEAQEGCHDDLIMALAIAYYARTQQRMKVEDNDIKQDKFNNFNVEKEKIYKGDYGSDITII